MYETLTATIHNHTLAFGITTNGSLLTKSMIDFFAKEFQYNFSISLDGEELVHDSNRKFIDGSGTYRSIIENFQYVKNVCPNVRVRMTYNTETVRYLYTSIQHIAELGFENIVAIPDFSDPHWEDKHLEILLSELTLVFENYYNNNQVDINVISDDITRVKGCCRGGRTSFNIGINGELYPCTWTEGNDNFKIGDIYSGVDIKKVEYLLGKSSTRNEQCDGCGLYDACDGTRCKIINKLITGSYHQPPVFRCEYNQIIYGLQNKYNVYRRNYELL